MKRVRFSSKRTEQLTFDGHWQMFSSTGSATEGDCLATISGLHMLWHTSELAVQVLQRVSANEFSFSGTHGSYTAMLQQDGSLQWNDGDVWVRRAPQVSVAH